MLFGVAIGAALAMVDPTPAQAQQATLRFSHWVPPVHVLHREGFQVWADAVQQAAGGSLRIQIFPAQQLGKAGDHYDMARDGVADLTHVNAGYQAGRFPIAAVTELPFLIGNATEGSEVLHRWYMRYAEREMGDVKVCLAFAFAPGAIHGRRPIRVPEDIRGLKVRATNATVAQMVTLLGGSSVHVAAPEMREAVERGVVDALTTPWGSVIRPWGVDKAAPHTLDMSFYSSTVVVAMNKAAYERLAEAQRKVIDEHCTPAWSRRIGSAWEAQDLKTRAELLAQPQRITHVPSAEERRRWREALQPLYAQWIKDASARGIDAQRALAELQSALRAAGALME
jgi:TRAP-type C4-dicarboxylate transport system substrate-binding protein